MAAEAVRGIGGGSGAPTPPMPSLQGTALSTARKVHHILVRMAQELAPEYPFLNYALGKERESNGDPRNAIAYYRNSLQYPPSAKAFCDLNRDEPNFDPPVEDIDLSDDIQYLRSRVKQADGPSAKQLALQLPSGRERTALFLFAALQNENDGETLDELAMLCFNMKRYQAMFELCQRGVELDFPRSYVGLGVCFQNGQGVPQDVAKAAICYFEAARQDDAAGQACLGWCYAAGSGVPQDDKMAADYYEKAAHQGHRGAQFSLGEFYEKGRGVAQDPVQARAWFSSAADQDHPEAIAALERIDRASINSLFSSSSSSQ